MFKYMRDNIATLPMVIQEAFKRFQKDIHTALPGRIESFDPDAQTAEVQLMIQRVYLQRDGISQVKVPETISKLINVPVAFPRGGGFSLTFPVKPGDECMVLFVERSFDLWRRSGRISLPGARRFHSFSDGVAYVGFSSEPNLAPDYHADNVELKADDGSGKLSLAPEGALSIETDAEVNVSSSAVNVDCDTADIFAASSISVGAPTITFDSPSVSFTGSISVTGAAALSGGVSASGGGGASIDGDLEVTGSVTDGQGTVLGTHTHPGDNQPPN